MTYRLNKNSDNIKCIITKLDNCIVTVTYSFKTSLNLKNMSRRSLDYIVLPAAYALMRDFEENFINRKCSVSVYLEGNMNNNHRLFVLPLILFNQHVINSIRPFYL